MLSWTRAFLAVFLTVLVLGFVLFGANLDEPEATLLNSTPVGTAEAEAYQSFLRHFARRANGDRGAVHVLTIDAALTGEELLAQRRRNAAPATSDHSRTCAGAPTIPVGAVTVVTVSTVDGDRTFAVYVPSSYETKRRAAAGENATGYTPAPVIFLIHGLNDNCERFIQNTGFMEYAEADGALVVSLCGTVGWLGTAFNAGMCCGFTGDKPDELAFILQALSAMGYGNESTPQATGHLQLCVNEEKILTVGFSNGAMLAEVLACRAPSVFRVVASIGGVTEPRPGGAAGLAKCTEDIEANNPAKSRPSVLMVHGDADSMVPWGGNTFLGFPAIPDNVEGWTTRNGCDVSSPTSTINDTHFVNTIYSNCTSESPQGSIRGAEWQSPVVKSTVEIVRVIGGAHLWPERDGFSTTGHIHDFAEAAFNGWD